MYRCKRAGFTIVELVIVMAVIAVLAAVLIPTFSSIVSKARENNAFQTARNAAMSLTTETGNAAVGKPVYLEYAKGKDVYRFLFDGHEIAWAENDAFPDFNTETSELVFRDVYFTTPLENSEFDPEKSCCTVYLVDRTHYVCYPKGSISPEVTFFVPIDPYESVYLLTSFAGKWNIVATWSPETGERGEKMVCGYPYSDSSYNDPALSAVVFTQSTILDILPFAAVENNTDGSGNFLSGVKKLTSALLVGYGSLTEITIPASVTVIDDAAFDGMSYLKNIYVEEDNQYYKSIDGILFSKDGQTIIRFPRNRTGDYVMPEGVTSIKNSAFLMTKANSLTIAASLNTEMTSNSIGNNPNMQAIYVAEGSALYSSSDGVLFSKDGTRLVRHPAGRTRSKYDIPDGVTTLCNACFAYTHITTLTIPASVEEIEPAFTLSYGFEEFVIDPGNQYFCLDDGVICSSDKTRVVHCPANKTGIYVMPKTVTLIDKSAFSNCISLSGVVFPEGLKTVTEYAFYNCTSFGNVTIPDSVTAIGSYAFFQCREMTSLTIPDSVKSLGSSSFGGCSKLANVSFEGQLTTIGSEAFRTCSALTEITLPQGIKILETNLFLSCVSLGEVTLPSTVKTVKSGCFRGCSALHTVNYQGSFDQWQNIYVDSNYNEKFLSAQVVYLH